MPPPTATAAVAAFRRRTAWGSFVGGGLRGLTAVAVAGALAQLGARLLGGYLVPQPAWALAAVPVVAAGTWAARRERLTPDVAAAHLDRRLGAAGLVLASRAAALDASFGDRLDAALAALPQALPRPRWSRLLPLPVTAAALAAGIALLAPPPPPVPPLPQVAATAELERLAEQLAELRRRGEVPAAVQQELQRALHDLEQRNAAGKLPDWRELDALGERLARERVLQDLARAAGDRSPGGAPSAADLAAVAQTLAQSGLLDRLPQQLAGRLAEAMRADGSIAAELLPQDPAQLAALADALAEFAARLGSADAGALGAGLDPARLAALRETLAQLGGDAGGGAGAGQARLQGAGGGSGAGSGQADGGGGGGVSRGPGAAALALTEDAQGAAANALPLPKGAVPDQWVPVGESLQQPRVDPQANTAPGGAATNGQVGASWQLELAPHHREVVRRFFDGAGGATGSAKENK